ncbi:MAG: peptidoglycan DD-metalloendopeptidase family protein [Candidatus Ancillula sp.]|jgi:murein DD-endopeptidase MepM/ murein hydrolase activator NlpD|nr:peptidoglycan DD-metalloendopeptidase family protein [Candidatus Ancillula sp.]
MLKSLDIRVKIIGILSIMSILILTISQIFVSGANAYDSNDPNQVYAAQAQNSKDLAAAQAASDGVGASLQQVQSDVDTLNVEIPAAQAALDTANSNLKAAKERLADIQERLKAAKADKKKIEKILKTASKTYDATKIAVAASAREDMRGSDSMLTAEMIFDSSNSNQFVETIQSTQQAEMTQSRLLTKSSEDLAGATSKEARIKIVNQQISDLNDQAQQQKDAAATAQDDAEKYSGELKSKQAELVTKQAELQKQKSALDAQIAEDKKQQEAISSDLAKLVSSSGGGGGYTGPTSGYFAYPTAYRTVTAPFGYYYGTRIPHYGVDFGAPRGSNVFAAAAGKIVKVSVDGCSCGREGCAKYIIVDHGYIASLGAHFMTGYWHLQDYASSHVGQVVAQGQVIGHSGNTGNSTGPHLHFQMWRFAGGWNPGINTCQTTDPLHFLNGSSSHSSAGCGPNF